MRTIRTKVYKFNELDEQGQQKAIELLSDINVDYQWWEYIYEDAKQIGLDITGFDMDHYCNGLFTLSAIETAQLIEKNHGKECETFKTAQSFLSDWSKEEAEFLRSLLEDYRIILRNEYEHLTSKETIIETIEANEYEFYANGKLI